MSAKHTGTLHPQPRWLARKKSEMADPAVAERRTEEEAEDVAGRIAALQGTVGYAFSDPAVAVAALLSSSSSNREARRLAEASGWTQHRLAWLGDSVLDLLLTDFLLTDHWELGAADRRRQHLCSNAFLQSRAKATGLLALAFTANTLRTAWPAGTLVEALVGAVFLDSGRDLGAACSVLCALGVLPE